MEYRQLGQSGLKVSALSFGAGTFGGGNEFFRAWGNTGVTEARGLVDICLDAGVNLFRGGILIGPMTVAFEARNKNHRGGANLRHEE